MLTCKDCTHARPVNGTLQCWRHPPTASAVVMPVAPTPSNPQGGIGVQAITVRPQVQPGDTCGDARARLAGLQ